MVEQSSCKSPLATGTGGEMASPERGPLQLLQRDFPPRALHSLNIKILALAVSHFVCKSAALPRLVSVYLCVSAACLSLPPWKQAAGPTVQTSDLNKHPERRLESWHARPCKSKLLGKKIGNVAEFQPVALQRAA